MLAQLLADSKNLDKNTKKSKKSSDENYSIDPPVETPWDVFVNKTALESDQYQELPVYLFNVGNNLILWARYDKKSSELNFMGPCKSKPRSKILADWKRIGSSFLYTIQKNRITDTLTQLTTGQDPSEKIISYRLKKRALYTLFDRFDLSEDFPDIKLTDLKKDSDNSLERLSLESILYFLHLNFPQTLSFALFEEINQQTVVSWEELLKLDSLKLDDWIDTRIKQIKTAKELISFGQIIETINQDLDDLKKTQLKTAILAALKEIKQFEKNYLLSSWQQQPSKKALELIEKVKNNIRGKEFSAKQYDQFDACKGLFVSDLCIRSNLKTERLVSIEERLLIWKSIFNAVQGSKSTKMSVEQILDQYFFEVPDEYVYLESDFIKQMDQDYWSARDVLLLIIDRYNQLKDLKKKANQDVLICPTEQSCQGDECLLYEDPTENATYL